MMHSSYVEHVCKLLKNNHMRFGLACLAQHLLEWNDPHCFTFFTSPAQENTEITLVIESLMENTVVDEFIFIPNRNPGNEQLNAMIRLFEHHTALESFQFDCQCLDDSFKINDEHLHKLCRAISQSKLKHFTQYNFTNFGDNGARILFSCLVQHSNHTIEKLYLANNNIGDDGAKEIADALSVNKSIRTLDIRNNNITDRGIKYICESLEKDCSVLEDLYLDCNPFSCDGVIAIGNMLKKNTSLAAIDITHISFGEDGKKTLLEGLKQKFFIQSIPELEFYTFLNEWCYRRILSKHNVPDGLWAHFLSRCSKTKIWDDLDLNEKFNLLYSAWFYFIRSKPELFIPHKFEP